MIFQRFFFIFLFIILLFKFSKAYAYADFIGFGYSSCMTCHFNGAGGGALNDYGRALFASEIAQRPFYAPNLTDDELAESSGFLGAASHKLGDHFRPGFKYRGLFVQSDPGTDRAISRFINMQADLNVAYIADSEQKKVIVASIGYTPAPKASNGKPEQRKTLTSHEYYLRWQLNPHFWIYTGFLDKTFGIRTPDHTAFSRAKTGLAQNDQAHGFVLQYASENHELFLNPFFGNLTQSEEFRQKGLGILYEYQPIDRVRLGLGGLASKNDFVFEKRAEGHAKFGLGKGNSLLMELGFIDNSPLDSNLSASSQLGAYGLLQGLMRIKRGLHLSSIGEYYKAALNSREADQLKWHLGFLYFPMQRMELRTELINSKTIAPDKVTDSAWSLQAQLHLSI